MERGGWGRLISGRRFQQLVAVRIAGTTADGLLEAALTSFVLFSPERQATPAKILVAFGSLLLPYSILGPFIGVAIDRWQRQRILIIATFTRAILVLGVAAIVANGRSGSSLAVGVLATLGVGRFVQATLSASLPHVVDDDLLVSANAVAPTAGTLMSIAGGMIGVGVATAMGGSDGASVVVICVASVFHLLSTALTTRMPRTLLGPQEIQRRTIFEVLAWLKSGIEHLAHRPRAARAILRVSTHRVVFGGSLLLVLMLTRNSFNDSAHATQALGQFSFVIGFAGFGAFIGAVLTPPLSEMLGVTRWARLVLVASAVAISGSYLYATTDPTRAGAWPVVLLGSTFIGFAGQCVKIASDTVVQTTVEDSHRGRVFAIYDMALNIGIVGGTAIGAVTMPTSGQSPAFALFLGVVLLLAASIRD